MKILCAMSFLLAMAFLTLSLNAQVQLGVQAGAQFADVTIDPAYPGEGTSTKTGFLFGGVLTYNFSPIFGIQFEPAYIQKGAAFSIKETVSTDIGDLVAEAEGNINADYLDLPVFLKASFGEGQLKPYLLAGLSVGFLLGDAKMELDKIMINGEDYINMIPSNEREEILDTKSTEFVLNFGAGLTIPVGKANIIVEGQYNLGLTDVNDDSEDDTTIKTKGFQAKAGILFPL